MSTFLATSAATPGCSLNPWMGSNPAFQPHDTELGHQRQIFSDSKAAEEGEMTASAHRDRKPLVVLGFELKGSAWMQFLVCVGGVFACSVLHDFLQELVFRHKEFEFGWFMTLCELGVIVTAATFALVTEKGFDEIAKTPWGQYTSLTIVLAITQGFGSVALSYVNYPVKVVIKSSKLIPTMALGLVVIRRSYSFAEYAAAVGVPYLCNGLGSVKHGINFGAVQTELISNHNQVMLCIGVAGFTLVDSTVQAKFHIVGIALLVGAVFGDAMTANLQERILRQMQCSRQQMMFASNLMAAGWVTLLVIGTGELTRALTLIVNVPEIGGQLLLQSLAQYLSVSFYLALVQRFGGVVAICVTSCRKILTICISFVVFSKPFSTLYIPTGLLTLVGILLSVVAKQQHPNRQHIQTMYLVGALLLVWFAGIWRNP